MIELNKIYCGNCMIDLKTFPDEFVNCCITSPPYYGLRDYGVNGQIGLEETPEQYVQKLVKVFSEVKRVLKPDGTLWLNLGDSYAGSGKASGQKPEHKNCGKIKQKRGYDVPKATPSKEIGLKPKDLIGIPWMVAFALRADGWYLRQDIIWHKPNPMPESVTDRCTKSHEYIFLLSRSINYYYDYQSIQEIATGFDGRKDQMFKGSKKYKDSGQTFAERGHQRWKYKNLQPDGQQPNTIHLKRAEGEIDENYPIRNKRSVWTVNTMPYSEAHFATFPELLISDCIKAGCPEDGIVLDPFIGAGTTGLVARKLNRNYVGIELNPEYVKIAEKRIFNEIGLFQ